MRILRAKYPSRWPWLRRTIEDVQDWLVAAKWWVLHRFHPKHRYHIINTGLGPGWNDRDWLLECLMVKMLVDYVEKEEPFKQFDLDYPENKPYREVFGRIMALYEFFKANDWREMETEQLNPKLHEIVDLHGHFWT